MTPTQRVRLNVRLQRQSQGLRLIDLAAGVTATGHKMNLNTLHRIEAGGRVVSVDDLVFIAAALGVTPMDLIEYTPDAEQFNEVEEMVAGCASFASRSPFPKVPA